MIGKIMDDGVHMHPNDKAREFFPEWFDDSLGISAFYDFICMGNTIIINHVMEYLGISSILDNCFDVRDANLIKDIIQYMIVFETTTMQHFPGKMKKMPIFSEKIYSDSAISKLFSEKISFNKQDQFLSEWNAKHTTDSIYVSYDSTNHNTYGNGIEIAEFGHSKDKDDLPIVNLSYATDQTTGTPLFYEIYPGSIVDMSQLSYAVEKLEKYGYKNIGLILDRGYFSGKNLKLIDDAGHDVIMMVKINQNKIKENIMKYQFNVRNAVPAYIGRHDTYGITVKTKINEKIKKEYYMHIYYNDAKGTSQRAKLLQAYERMNIDLKKTIEEKKFCQREDLKRFEEVYRFKYDDFGYMREYERYDDKIQKEADLKGYFVLITSKEMTAGEALDIYRNRDVVEKLFRSLKTELDYDCFRVYSEESMEAKTFVTFIASIVRNEIFQKTRNLKDESKKEYTVPAILEEMNGVYVIKDSEDKYIMRHALTGKQKQIFNQFDISEEEVKQFAKDLKKIK